MDPKNSPSLDPKLKEIYDRVMGTNVAPGQSPNKSVSPPPPPPPPRLPNQPLEAPRQAVQPSQMVSSASYAQKSPLSSQTVHINSQNNYVPGKNEEKKEEKKSSNLIPILLFFGGIIFFAAYAYFWMKILNVKLPFLPS